MTRFIDRMAHLRDQPEALAEEAAREDAVLTLVWRGRSHLTKDDGGALRGVWRRRGELPPLPAGGVEVYLGRDERGVPRLVRDVSAAEAPEALGLDGRFSDLMRAGWSMTPEEFEPLAYARGMAHWHFAAAHCERCGTGRMAVTSGGFKRTCLACEATAFPRSDPAVMMLVTRGDRCLLARQARFPPGMYSALAGFVEPGESLEGCVIRETKEEVGLTVSRPRYFASQPWPFPQSLMIGFFAEAEEDDFALDQDEIDEARWVSRAELEQPEGFFYPPPMSLAHHLIEAFKRGA